MDNVIRRFLSGRNLYQAFLHIFLVILIAEVIILAKQNDNLKKQFDVKPQNLAVGEYLSLSDLNPLNGEILPDSSQGKLVYIFSTHCPYCILNLPNWKKLAVVAKQNKIATIMILLEGPDSARAYLNKNGLEGASFTVVDFKKFRVANKISSIPQIIECVQGNKVRNIWIGTLSDVAVTEAADSIERIERTVK